VRLVDLLAECYRRCSYSAAPPAEVRERFTGHVNDTQQELASDPALVRLLRGTTTFSSAISVAEYGLPPAVARVWTLRETTNNRRLRAMSLDAYRSVAPDPAQQSGSADWYSLLGPMSVAVQPASATSVFILSTDPNDASTAQIEVVTAGGFTRTVSVPMQGSTGVSLGINDIEQIVDWFLDDAALGVVTLRAGSPAGTELGRIGIGTRRTRYQGLALLPTPAAVVTYLVEYERAVTDLVNPEDAPGWLPEPFHRLLAIGARRRHWEDQREADRYSAAQTDWAVSLAKLKAFVNNPPDATLIPGGHGSERSDLGGHYPAGTIWN
jgi:hypothetical protein